MAANGSLSPEQVEARTRELLWDVVKERATVEDIHAMLPDHVRSDPHALGDMKRGLRRVGWRPGRPWFGVGSPRLPVNDRDVRYGLEMAADTVADLGRPGDLDAAAAIACVMALRRTFMRGPGAIA